MIQGIDCASFDDPIDPDKLWDYGVRFVYIKASGGTAYTNPNYARDKAALKARGILVGAYHYQSEEGSAGSGLAEFSHFASVIGDVTGDLPPCADIETPRSDIHQWAREFVAANRKAFGKDAVYGSPGNLGPWLQSDPFFAESLLWVAHYGVQHPDVPPPWKAWTIWQYGDVGPVPGVSAGNVDHDAFDGDIMALESLVIGADLTPNESKMLKELHDFLPELKKLRSEEHQDFTNHFKTLNDKLDLIISKSS